MRNLFPIAAGAAALLFCAVLPVHAQDPPTAVSPAPLDPRIQKLVTAKITDVTATLHVTETDMAELQKAGSSFKETYRFKRMNVAYKYPNRLRMQTKVLGQDVLLVYNGDVRYYKIPLHSESGSVAGHPGEKQSLLQFGVFAPDYLELDYEPHFVRTDSKGLAVVKLTQRRTQNKSFEMLFINPQTHLIERRESFNGDGKLNMELRYLNPTQVSPGIYVPTRIEIYNPEGKRGAVQTVENLKVNTGVSDAQFATS